MAEAAEAGIVNGYPDGTFRPDTPVTRAEYIKLLVAAGRLRPGNCIGGPLFRDTGGHWLEAAGYLCTAGWYGVVDENDYPEDCLKPDEPITRLEMAVMAERLLGRGYQAANEVAAPLPFLDAAGIPERARGWVGLAVQDGIITCYPDGTFRGHEGSSRAEAVAAVLRTLDVMTAGVQPELRLEVSGKPVALPVPLAIRDGLVYVPVRAVYEAFGSSWGVYVGNDPQGAQYVLYPGNDAFRASSLRLEFPAGAPLWRLREWWKPGESTSSQGSLLGPSYLLYGELMVPAARTGGEGMLPYARVHFDAQAATVRVDITPDWPGYHLPASPAGVRLLLRTGGPLKLEPGMFMSIPGIAMVDANGREVDPVRPLSWRYEVEPGSPLRLRVGTDGQPMQSFTFTRDPSTQPFPDVYLMVAEEDPVPEGTYNLTITSPGYAPLVVQVAVADHRPYCLAFDPIPEVVAGQEQVITLRVLDRRGRLVDWCEYLPGPVLLIGQPDGSTVSVPPQTVTEPVSNRPRTVLHGVATFRFIPPVPGTYVYTAVARLASNPEVELRATAAGAVRAP